MEQDIEHLIAAGRAQADLFRAYAGMLHTTPAERELYDLKARSITRACNRLARQLG